MIKAVKCVSWEGELFTVGGWYEVRNGMAVSNLGSLKTIVTKDTHPNNFDWAGIRDIDEKALKRNKPSRKDDNRSRPSMSKETSKLFIDALESVKGESRDEKVMAMIGRSNCFDALVASNENLIKTADNLEQEVKHCREEQKRLKKELAVYRFRISECHQAITKLSSKVFSCSAFSALFGIVAGVIASYFIY